MYGESKDWNDEKHVYSEMFLIRLAHWKKNKKSCNFFERRILQSEFGATTSRLQLRISVLKLMLHQNVSQMSWMKTWKSRKLKCTHRFENCFCSNTFVF